MPIENFDEIKTYFETNKDTDEVKNYLGGLVTPERINTYLDTDAGKKVLQPRLDSYATKAITTHDAKFKENELPKLVAEEIKKKYPEKDPRDIEIEQIKIEQERLKKESARERNLNKALKVATEKNIPSDLLDYFVTDDETISNDNLTKLSDILSKHDDALKAAFSKEHNFKPIDHHSGDNITKEQFKKMNIDQKTKLYNENKELYEKLKQL